MIYQRIAYIQYKISSFFLYYSRQFYPSLHNKKLDLLQNNLHSDPQPHLIRKMSTQNLIRTFCQNLRTLGHIVHPILNLKLKNTILSNPNPPILPIYTKFFILILTRYIHTLKLITNNKLRFIRRKLFKCFLGLLLILLSFADRN